MKSNLYFCKKCGMTISIPEGEEQHYQYCPRCACKEHKYKIIKKVLPAPLKTSKQAIGEKR